MYKTTKRMLSAIVMTISVAAPWAAVAAVATGTKPMGGQVNLCSTCTSSYNTTNPVAPPK